MKTAIQIAKECEENPNYIRQIVYLIGIKGVKVEGNKKETAYTEHQEQKIHQFLCSKGRLEYLTLESKMNYENTIS